MQKNKKTFKSLNLTEAKKDSIVLAWGRFNPPTTGHEKLINTVVAQARKRGADYRIYPTKSEDPKKNPLTFKEKVRFMRKMFPRHAKNISSDEGVNTVIKAAQKLEKEGLENLHKFIPIKILNDARMYVYSNINKNEWILNKMINLFKNYIDNIVGNEIAVRKKVNLSIQLPNDNTSILPMHSDFFSGESLYQLNLWLPLVSVKKTSSMFYFSPKDSLKMINIIKKNPDTDLNKLFKNNFGKIKWLDMKQGQGSVFSPNLLHGNTINKEKQTRISLNLRVKNIYSPYNDLYGNEKKLGSFYKPYELRGMTNFNLKHSFSFE